MSRLLLTSGSQLADIEENHDKNGEDEREDELPSAGTARTAWLSLQQYLVSRVVFLVPPRIRLQSGTTFITFIGYTLPV